MYNILKNVSLPMNLKYFKFIMKETFKKMFYLSNK